MATLRDIKAKINTVGNIGKITRAMQLVAAAKLTRAMERAHAGRPYSDELNHVLRALAEFADTGDDGSETPITMRFDGTSEPVHTTLETLFRQVEAKRPGVVLFTSDRGLCGAFNTNLIRAAQLYLDEHSHLDCRLITLGRKGHKHFRRHSVDIAYAREGISDRLVLDEIREITAKLVELYATGEVDAIDFIYARSIHAAKYEITTERFLGIPRPEGAEGASDANVIVEPDPERLFSTLIPLYATTRVYSALADSFASEYGAKMAAMQQATKNADEKLGELVILRNRLRQAAITKELAEIVGGAEALK